MNTLCAVLIDVPSIQNYVYSGNRLKENVGASYLVQEIYGAYLQEAVDKTFGHNIVDINAWRQKPGSILMREQENLPCEVGYIGGGNALLLFKYEGDEKCKAKELIQNWTLILLEKVPGLATAVAIKRINIEDLVNNYQNEMSDLFQTLAENKSKYYPNTTFSKHGITADCKYSGLTAEVFHEGFDDEEPGYISCVSKAKLKASEDSKRFLEEKFKDELEGKYTFASLFSEFGQTDGSNHIAIVYIDGNKMSSKFRKCKDLVETRELSIAVQKATDNSFKQLIKEDVIKNMGFYLDSGLKFKKDDEHKQILPIRPIVLSGDDITFVCNGKLGVYLAERFINHFSSQSIGSLNNLTACAGIAITKTKYPFFRGYELSEELCQQAKSKSREYGDTSWLDFHIVYGGFVGNLQSIRSRQFNTVNGNLHFGPYRIDNDNDNKSFYYIKRGIDIFRDNEKWPRSKLMEFRSLLHHTDVEIKEFIESMQNRGLLLPELNEGSQYHKKGWENKETPYFDMIELMDFYLSPEQTYKKTGGESDENKN